MAKPNKKVLVRIVGDPVFPVEVWVNNPISVIDDIKSIEGVNTVSFINGNPILVSVDPRYEIEDIAREIEGLLAAEVPDVFKNPFNSNDEILGSTRQR